MKSEKTYFVVLIWSDASQLLGGSSVVPSSSSSTTSTTSTTVSRRAKSLQKTTDFGIYADGLYNYARASYSEKEKILGQLEKYTLDNFWWHSFCRQRRQLYPLQPPYLDS
jgi:hypothetical protein